MIPGRDHVLVGKERHDIGRPQDWGYPIRGIFKNDMLYIRNFEIDRWPAGNPETGYLNCDGPTKTTILQLLRTGNQPEFWDFCFGKRPTEELYDLKLDPDCVNNLANSAKHRAQRNLLAAQLVAELTIQQDPRILGESCYFDEVVYSSPGTRNFYERFMRGEKVSAGWVNAADFETKILSDSICQFLNWWLPSKQAPKVQSTRRTVPANSIASFYLSVRHVSGVPREPQFIPLFLTHE